MRLTCRSTVLLMLAATAFAAGCSLLPASAPVAPTATLPPPAVTQVQVAPTAVPSPSPAAPAATTTVTPTASRAPATQSPQPTSAASAAITATTAPRTLNLGVAAGNTYAAQAEVMDRRRGLLYVLGRGDGYDKQQTSIAVVSPASGQVQTTSSSRRPSATLPAC